MRVVTVVFFMFFTLRAFGGESMLEATPYTQVQQKIGQGKPAFLEVGSDSCRSCKIMGSMLSRVTQQHPEYPVYFINVKREREAASLLKIMMIPTQIIYDKEGKEVYRHIGVLSEDELSDLFVRYQF